MARMSLTKAEYEAAGAAKDLTLTGPVPFSVQDKTRWVCNHCKKVHVKTYRAVYLGKYGCTCRSTSSLSDDDYKDLADRLGLILTGMKPSSSKIKTEWWSKQTKEHFEASYYELAYARKIPQHLQDKVIVPDGKS